MFYNILDKKRIDILPLLKNLKKDFYLSGGTALALQIGHRDSIDFNFFNKQDIDTKKLFEVLRKIFKGHSLLNIQEEYNTLTILVDGSIKISFFTHKYKLIKKTINDANLSLASLEDIICMKLSAITGRASNKDYIDIYFILKNFSLSDLLKNAHIKYPELEKNLILKSLVYFEDITQEKILFKNNNHIVFEEVKNKLREEVKKFSKLCEITKKIKEDFCFAKILLYFFSKINSKYNFFTKTFSMFKTEAVFLYSFTMFFCSISFIYFKRIFWIFFCDFTHQNVS